MMRVGSDSFIMIVILLVCLGASVVAATLFFEAEVEDFVETNPGLVSASEVDSVEARRSSGPSRAPLEKNVSLIEEKSEKPIILPKDGEGLIEGLVVDEEGAAVPGARVLCDLHFPIGELNYSLVDEFHRELKTEDDGSFRMMAPSQGFFRIQVRHELHAPQSVEGIQVGANLNFKLTKAAGMMGYVRSSLGGVIVGATISLRQENGVWRESIKTDADGRYGLPGLPNGKVIVDVSAPEFLKIDDQVLELSAAEILEQDFVLGAGRAISGTIVDGDGMRIGDVEISVGSQKVMSDDIGRFRIGGLAQAAHNLQVVAEGFLTHHQSVNLSGSREEAKIELQLSRGGCVTGIVMDDTGSPVADAEIKVFQTWGDGDYMWDTGETRYITRTDENGAYRIDGLMVQGWSKHRARAAKEGFAHAFSDTFSIKDKDQPTHITIIMRPGGELSGTVRDESGRILEGVKMTLNRNNVQEWSGKRLGQETCLTDAEGRYHFDRLSAGQYRVSAMARGYATVYKGGIEVLGAALVEGQDFTLKEGGIVKGSVKTPEGTPIEGARIHLNSSSSWGTGETNAEGEYVIRNVGEGPYWVTAYSSGYSRERKNKEFPIDGRIDFELRRDGYVWGKVVESEDERPVKQFHVSLFQQESQNGSTNWRQKAQTWVNDAEGKFKLYAPDGTYKLVISAQGFIKKEIENIALSVDAEPEEMTVKVVAGGAIEGWVKDMDGNPLRWAQVYCRNSNGGKWYQRTHTETDGYYYLDALETGTYEIAFDRRGMMPLGRREFINVNGGDIVRVDYTQQDRCQVAFQHVVPDDGDPSPRWMQITVTSRDGRLIAIHSTGWSREGRNVDLVPYINYSLRRGQMTISRDLPPGEYDVEIKSKGYETIRQILTLKNNDDLEFHIELEKEKKDDRN